MGAADAQPAVAHGDDDLQVRTGHLDAGGVSQRPAVQAVEGMGVKESIEKARAADIGDDGHILATVSHRNQGFVQGTQHLVVGAARTENRRPACIQQTIHWRPPP